MTVTWKDEDELDGESIGPCFAYENDDEVNKPRRMGRPLPASIQDKGWMSRKEAQRLAEILNATFQEY